MSGGPAASVFGALLIAGLFALLAASVGAPLIVSRFRRRVLESMNRASPAGVSEAAAAPARANPASFGPIPRVSDAAQITDDAQVKAAVDDANRQQRRLALAYTAGATAHALILAGFALVAYAGSGLSTAIALCFLAVFLLPLAPLLGYLLTASATRTWLCAGLVLVVVLVLAGPARGLVVDVAQLHLLVPALLFALLQLRYWRATAPLLLPLGFAVGLGWMLGYWMAASLEMAALIWPFRLVGAALGYGLARWMMRRMAIAYRAKSASDQEIFIDSNWLFYTLVQTLILMIKGGTAMLPVLASFLVFRAVRRAMLRGQMRDRPARALLLLRVFGHDARTEQLLDALTLRWRAIGTVQLIAGPDLAARNLDPHELHAFLGGTLAREFVRDAADLEARLAAMDRDPDPDGRYRITQFYCHRDTWQPAVDALIEEDDAVLMDLRGLTRERAGCQWELTRLATHRGRKPIVLLVDRSSDVALIESCIGGAPPAGAAPACLVDADALRAQTLPVALRLLLGERLRN